MYLAGCGDDRQTRREDTRYATAEHSDKIHVLTTLMHNIQASVKK